MTDIEGGDEGGVERSVEGGDGAVAGYQLAQVNIGRILGPLDGSVMADFMAQLPEINGLADKSPGFVWRMTDEGGDDSTGLRPDDHDDMMLINCSVWTSVQALKDFTYHSEHLRVLSHRREWFEKIADHTYALWWVPAGHRPTEAEAYERVAILRERGPGPLAFTFREPWPAPEGGAGANVDVDVDVDAWRRVR